MKKKLISIIAIALVVVSICVSLPLIISGNKAGFDEKNIVLSFSAMSDIHQQMGKTGYADKLVNALDFSKQLNGGKDLDLALFAGDLTEETWRQQNDNYNENYNGDIEMLKNTLDRAINFEKTAVFYSLGNHDTDPSQLGSEYMKKMPALFVKMLGEKYFAFDSNDSMPEIGLRHVELNGYNFLAVQPDYYWKLRGYSQSTLDWIDAKLSQITSKEPNKYVFVTAHPPIYGTVFGSFASDWADNDLAQVLQKYPQVIYFSGHIHNVLQDEIQISQNGSFTAVDCGSVKYTEVMNDINDSRTTSFDNYIGTRIEDFSQGLFVQVDNKGNVRITRCDYYKKQTIKDAWVLNKPNKDKSHLATYDNQTRIDKNLAPTFSSGANFTAEKTVAGVSFNWDCATDDDMVRYYYLVLYQMKNGSKVKIKEYNVATFTYRYSQVEQMQTKLSYEGVGQFSGELIAELYAVDVWNKRSDPLTAIVGE